MQGEVTLYTVTVQDVVVTNGSTEPLQYDTIVLSEQITLCFNHITHSQIYGTSNLNYIYFVLLQICSK